MSYTFVKSDETHSESIGFVGKSNARTNCKFPKD